MTRFAIIALCVMWCGYRALRLAHLVSYEVIVG